MTRLSLLLLVLTDFTLSSNAAQQQMTDVEKTIRIVENEKETLRRRADAVDKLVKMPANDAAPRLLNVLVKRKSYVDILDSSILNYFVLRPTAQAIPFLLEYEDYANKHGIHMHSKVRTVFDDAMEACKKVKKSK